MAAQSDNSREKNSKSVSPRIGEGIVMDIGTGDGRFVSAAAKKHPNKFFIGVDANRKPLEKPSMRATRKPGKGGLPNAIFVEAAIESLPEEFAGVADEIHIHFPWGSLLRVVTIGNTEALASLSRIAAPDCLLEVVLGIDAERDRAELERLGVPELSLILIHSYLVPKYRSAGFEPIEIRELQKSEWTKIESSWAKRLSPGDSRKVFLMLFRAVKRG